MSFIPKPNCTAMSGDCFRQSRCIQRCAVKQPSVTDEADARRMRFVLTMGSLPTKTIAGYHYRDGVFYPTPREAIDAAMTAMGGRLG